MKRISIIVALIAGASVFFSCEKDDKKNPPVIDMEHHYEMVYMLGAAAEDEDGNQHWDSADPMPMEKTDDPDVFAYELDLVRSTENKLIKFCLTAASWDKADFLVPEACEEGQSYAFLKEGVNKLVMTSEAKDGVGNLKDWFFGISEGQSGTYRLEVNTSDQTLTATKIASLPDPEIVEWEEGTLYMVGDATPNGWDINNPTPMIKDEANANIHTWEGELKAGEIKIVTEFNWNSATYRPETANTEISKDGIASNTVSLDADGDTSGDDNKWKVTEAGKYKLTLDTENLTLNVEWLGE